MARNEYGAHNVGSMTRRILRWYDRATPEQVLDGTTWYFEARRFAGDLAARTPYSVEQVAALIAVLSPQVNWAKNCEAAVQAIEQHLAGDVERDTLDGYSGYKANVRKAWRVLDGDVHAVAGPKVRAFYGAIIGDLSHVTVDVWATRAARPAEHNAAYIYRDDEMPGVRERRAITEAYRRAAVARGLTPSEMQAVVWVAIRASGEYRRPQQMSATEAMRFYGRQKRARAKLGLFTPTGDYAWNNASRARMALGGVA